jgi:hypothetical protein
MRLRSAFSTSLSVNVASWRYYVTALSRPPFLTVTLIRKKATLSGAAFEGPAILNQHRLIV